MSFECDVLSDGTRIITQTDFMEGMGMYYSGWVSANRTDEDIAADTPQFLAFKTLKPFVDRHLGDLQSITVEYRTKRGSLARGIKRLKRRWTIGIVSLTMMMNLLKIKSYLRKRIKLLR